MKVHCKQMDYARAVGSNIRAIRTGAGIKVKEVAERVGMKADTLSNLELGKCAPHITTLKEIADALGCDVKDFL